jgi:hypothetical protein
MAIDYTHMFWVLLGLAFLAVGVGVTWLLIFLSTSRGGEPSVGSKGSGW